MVFNLLASALVGLTLMASDGPKGAHRKPAKGPQIIERVIKIEGMLEKPRVIFIVPRARLWKEYIFRKSFVRNLMEPVHPPNFPFSVVEKSEGEENK